MLTTLQVCQLAVAVVEDREASYERRSRAEGWGRYTRWFAESVERVLAHRDQAEFVTATYDGTRSHPAVIARSLWDRIPDDGGRGLDALLVPCDDLTPPGDIDTPDLARDL